MKPNSWHSFGSWMRWRLVTRLVLAGPAAAVAIALGAIHEMTVWHWPHPEALLFAAPSDCARSHAFLTAQQTPIQHHKSDGHCETTTISIPISVGNLAGADFAIRSHTPNVQWQVVQAEFVPNVTERIVGTSPLSVALMFDQSGSIEVTDPGNVRIPAAERLVSQLPPASRIAVLHFPDTVFGLSFSPATVDAPFTTNTSDIDQAIGSLAGRQSGGTPLFPALMQTLNLLAGEDANRKRILICLSDGLPDGDQNGLDAGAVQARAIAAHVCVYFIAFGQEDWTALRSMVRATGGDVIAVDSAAQLDSAFRSLAGRVAKVDHSYYRVTLCGRRARSPFLHGERLTAHLQALGHSWPFTLTAR